MSIQVVLLHPNPVIITGLCSLLESSPIITVIKTTASKDELFAAMATQPPDVIILPYTLLDGSSIPLVETLANATPPIPTIVYTRIEEDDAIKNMLAAGITGYVLHNDPPAMLLGAIQTVAAGQP